MKLVNRLVSAACKRVPAYSQLQSAAGEELTPGELLFGCFEEIGHNENHTACYVLLLWIANLSSDEADAGDEYSSAITLTK